MRYAPLLLLIFLASCGPSLRKAADKLRQNPAKLAELCSEQFPAKPPVLIPGKSDTLYEVVLQAGDSIIVPCPPMSRDTVRIKAACPPVRIETRYVTRVDTFQVDLSRYELAAAKAEIGGLKSELSKEQANGDRLARVNRILWWILIIAGIALLGWGYWRIKAGALNSVINKLK